MMNGNGLNRVGRIGLHQEDVHVDVLVGWLVGER
jgi:hypothetical protein